MTRPLSVTIVAWIVIVLGAAGASLMVIGISKVPFTSMQIIFAYTGLAVAVVSGLFMLGGKNWSCWLYVVWCIFGLAYALTTVPNPFLLVPGAVKTAIIAFVLFRKPANLFFLRAVNHVPAGP